MQETEAVVTEPAKKSTATAKQTVASKRAEPPANAARQTAGAAPATARRDQPPPLDEHVAGQRLVATAGRAGAAVHRDCILAARRRAGSRRAGSAARSGAAAARRSRIS